MKAIRFSEMLLPLSSIWNTEAVCCFDLAFKFERHKHGVLPKIAVSTFNFEDKGRTYILTYFMEQSPS
jgi:hypothetical protein